MDNQDSSVYDNLVEKIVKAVPDRKCHKCDGSGRIERSGEPYDMMVCICPSITLDDVLRSLPRIVLDQITFSMPLVGETFRIRFKDKFADIILGKPLSDQSLETQLFLNSII